MKVKLIFWDLQSLRAAINAEIGHIQSAEKVEFSTKQNLYIYSYSSVSTDVSTVALQVSTENKFSSLGKCHFCSGDHFAINSTKFNSLESRKSRVLKQQLCFNCLHDGTHLVQDCVSRSRCPIYRHAYP